jgi:hypothetical protein
MAHMSYSELFHIIARIKECQDSLRRATRHVVNRAAKCIDVDVGILLGKLYRCHLNNKYRY